MGPRATWAFCQALTREFSFDKEKEHPRILVDCNTQIPSRTRAILYDEESPVAGSIESIGGLINLGATIIAAPCNQIHYWHDEIQSQISVPWPNMIEMIANKLADLDKVLILGGLVTTQKQIYTKYLPSAIYPDKSLWEEVRAKIEAGKHNLRAGRIDDLIFKLVKCRPDFVLLACTELSASPEWTHWIGSSLEIYAHEITELVKNG